MAYTRLSPKATYVTRGFGQVEPNHLSAQRTGEIYAQLPADPAIKVLENGMFVKYDYAARDAAGNGVGMVNFKGPGEWMLVYNEIKLYRDYEVDHDFAMLAPYYNARVYSPIDGEKAREHVVGKTQEQTMGRVVEDGKVTDAFVVDGVAIPNGRDNIPVYDNPMAPAFTYWDYEGDDPFIAGVGAQAPGMPMPEGTRMVPRVFKTHEGDIFTTNTIKSANNNEDIVLGAYLKVDSDGYLTPGANIETDNFVWQIVKVYNMPDMQPGVKVMRVK